MHTFQPYPMELLEWNPWEKISKEWFAVTTELDGKPNAMTASWGGIGHIWGKNVAFIFIRESRYTKEILDKTDCFSACFLDPNDPTSKPAYKFLASASGRQVDKIKEWNLSVNHAHDIPYLDESNFTILCKKLAAIPMTSENMLDPSLIPDWYKDGDYHTIYIGEIVEILAR